MADTLRIEIDTASAKQALDALRASFQQTVVAAEQFGTRGAAGIKKFGEAMASLKPIDASVANSIQAFNMAMQNLKAGAVGGVATELNKLAKVDVAKVATNVKALTDSLATLKIPPGLDAMAATFGNLARSAQQAGVAIKAASTPASNLQKSIGALNREITNSVGFMGGLGVSVGNLVAAFQSVQQASGGTINSIGALLSSMGKIPGAVAVAGAAFLVFKGVQAIIENLISPVIRVTQEFRSFRLAIDAMRGAEAGAKALESLRGIANRTGTDIMTLTANFKQFEASASASGMSAAQSSKIFEQFSGAFRVLGNSTQQTQLAFRALTQMMSKGTVQAEELRGQLGENLPGSVQIFAQALGVSTRALDKMMKSGQVLSADVLPKVADLLSKQYGNALALSLGNVDSQMNRLSNTWTFLLKALGEGNINGIFGGVADGLRQIADAAAKSEGIEALARIIGDVLGRALQDILQSIAVVINLFTSMVDIVYTVGQAVGSVLPSWEQLSNFVSSLVAPLTAAVGAMVDFGAALGTIALTQFVTDVTTVATAISNWVTNSKLAQAAFTALTTVIQVLMNLLGGSLWTAFASVFGLMADGINQATGKLKEWTSDVVNWNDVASQATGNTTASAEALAQFKDEANSAADAIVATAYSITSYATAQASAAQQISATEKTIRGMQSALKDQDSSMRNIQRLQKDFTDGIRQENQALEKERAALQKRSQALQRMEGDSGKIASENVQRSIEALSEKIRNNSEAIEDANLSFGERIRMEGEFRDSMQESIRAEQERNAILKEYGVALSDSGKESASFLMSMGQQKDAAVSLAFAIDQATMSMDDRIKKMQEEADRQEELASWAHEQIRTIQDETQAKLENMRVRGDSAEVIAAEARISEQAVTQIDKLKAGALAETAALRAVILARRDGISISEAANRVADDLSKTYGVNIDKTKLVGDAIKQLSGKQIEGKGSAEQLAEANKKAGKSIEEQKDDAAQLQTALQNIGTKAEETAGKIEATTETWTNFSVPVKTAGEGMRILADSFSRLSLNMPIVQTSIGQLNEVLPAFSAQMTLLSEVAPKLGEEFPKFAAAVTELNTAIAAMSESLPTFAANLRSIGEAGEGALRLSEAFKELIATINESEADILKAADNLNTLASTAGKVSTTFDQAGASAAPMLEALEAVTEAAERAEEAFRRMEDAAKDALAAAKAAGDAAGGGGADASAQREGGMAGDRMQTQKVNMDAFRSAPKFAEGIGNTSMHPSRVPGGGIPSILHPNEAVIPLSRGRKIPVDVKLDMPDIKMPKMEKTDNGEWTHSLDYLSVSIDNLSDSVKTLADVRSFEPPTLPKIELPEVPSVHVKPEAPEVQHRITPDEAFDPARTAASSTRTDRVDRATTERNAQIINITVHATDADSFKRTEDQIVRSLGRKIQRAERRGG